MYASRQTRSRSTRPSRPWLMLWRADSAATNRIPVSSRTVAPPVPRAALVSRGDRMRGPCSRSSLSFPVDVSSNMASITLDGISLLHRRSGRFPADMRLRRTPAAIIVPSFASQFSGQVAELLDHRHTDSPLGMGWSEFPDDTMVSSPSDHRDQPSTRPSSCSGDQVPRGVTGTEAEGPGRPGEGSGRRIARNYAAAVPRADPSLWTPRLAQASDRVRCARAWRPASPRWPQHRRGPGGGSCSTLSATARPLAVAGGKHPPTADNPLAFVHRGP